MQLVAVVCLVLREVNQRQRPVRMDAGRRMLGPLSASDVSSCLLVA